VGTTRNPPGPGSTRARERPVRRFFALALLLHAELLLLLGLGLYLFAPRDADLKAQLAASKEPESIDIGSPCVRITRYEVRCGACVNGKYNSVPVVRSMPPFLISATTPTMLRQAVEPPDLIRCPIALSLGQ